MSDEFSLSFVRSGTFADEDDKLKLIGLLDLV
jgi:hypothetical protein